MFLEILVIIFYLFANIILGLHLADTFIKVFSVFKEKKAAKQEEKEEVIDNNILEESVFTTHELAEVERFRQRMEALRRDRDGLYDVVDSPITTFTGVEASE